MRFGLKTTKGKTWPTIQVVGDVPVNGENIHRNIFSDALDPDDTVKKRKSYDGNPLSGHHPYTEFCANPIELLFLGSFGECATIALMQESISKRINGIERFVAPFRKTQISFLQVLLPVPKILWLKLRSPAAI